MKRSKLSVNRARAGRVRSRAKTLAARTNGKLGGAPRYPGKRCPCGDNTLHRAEQRAFACCKAKGVVPRTARRKKGDMI